MSGRKAAGLRLLLILLMVILLLLLVCRWSEKRLRPVTAAAGEAQITARITALTEEALRQTEPGLRSYEQLVRFHYDKSGNLAAVSANLDHASRLQTALWEQLEQLSGEIREENLTLPLASLFSLPLPTKLQLSVPVRVESIYSSACRMESELEEVGINQMLHRIWIVIETEVTILIPGGTAEFTAESRLPLAESLILGKVPDSYSYFSQGA